MLTFLCEKFIMKKQCKRQRKSETQERNRREITMPKVTENTPIRNACREIIRKAGEGLIQPRGFEIEEKNGFKNLVTTCDERTQEFLMTELGRILPEATFLCEENNVHDTSGRFTFIIDPIDGTTNFIHDYHMSAISVALADREEICWGIVYNPFTGELYEAEKGQGAFLNGTPIAVRQTDLAHTMVGFGTSPYNAALKERSFYLAEKTLDACIDLRRSGSAALDLCFTARGSYGLFFELEESPWDFAAGLCIVREAGGKVVDFEGHVPDFTKKTSIIAGCPQIVDEFFAKVVDKSRDLSL